MEKKVFPPEWEIANLNMEEAARLLGISRSTLKRRMQEGLPHVVEPGSTWTKFSIADILRWQEQYKITQEPRSENETTPEGILKIIDSIRG